MWFRVTNVSESELVSSVQPCRFVSLQQRLLSQAVVSSVRGTNVTLELLLPNASRQDEGLYACQVENIKTGERTCLLRRLSLKGKVISLSVQLRSLEKLSFLDQCVHLMVSLYLKCLIMIL